MERFMLSFAKALSPLPNVKHASENFALAEFPGICIVLKYVHEYVLLHPQWIPETSVKARTCHQIALQQNR